VEQGKRPYDLRGKTALSRPGVSPEKRGKRQSYSRALSEKSFSNQFWDSGENKGTLENAPSSPTGKGFFAAATGGKKEKESQFYRT